MASRADFDPDELERFWGFVAERQRVWHRRVVLGEAPPWTDDAVLRRQRFTNVYRVLDPGTQYVLGSILDREAPRPDRLFNALVYRLIGRQETHEYVGFQRLDAFDVGSFEASLRERRESGEPVFTGAYLVAGYSGFGGEDKVENVARLFGEVRDRFRAFHADVRDASRPGAVYAAIRSLPGFGNFLAYQVLVDLLYPLPGHGDEPFLPFSPDAWAAAGPGAQEGLDVLVADGAEVPDLAAMRWLRRHQTDEFDRLDVDFPWLRDDAGRRMELSLADVQNCCCEFYKYHKVRTGQGRTRRRFRTEEARSLGEIRSVYEGYPVSVKPDDYAVASARRER